MAGNVLLPAYVAENQAKEARIQRTLGARDALVQALRGLDSQIDDVVFLGEDEANLSPACRPNRWHVRRRNTPPTADSYLCICDPETGGYLDPHFGVYEALKRADLQNRDVFEEVRSQLAREQKEAEAREALASEQRIDLAKESIRAGLRVAGEGGMTARKWGKK